MTDRRFIEESFPVRDVSAIAAKEKNIRHGHICTFHIWWARRPLAASRATAYATLTPAADDITEWQRQRDFIVELSKWENSLNTHLLERARREILEANGGRSPCVLDPFAGGGAIPLEALRLGCETYASDYNPVAVLILKAMLEYPQKFGQPVEREEKGDLFGGLLTEKRSVNPLLEAVKQWRDWVLEEARMELADFYPSEPDGSIPVGYIWARTIPCQNPACGAEIPLMRQFWLANKAKKKVALYPEVVDGWLTLRIVGDGYDPWPEGFDPKAGTVSRAVATCPVCGAVVDANTTRRLFQDGKAGQRIVTVVLKHPKRQGKTYRLAIAADEAMYHEAGASLQTKREQLMLEWGLDPVPDEPTPEGKGRGAERAFSVRNYGVNAWGSLFNVRQQLALITFAEQVRRAYVRMVAGGAAPEFAKAVVTYLGLGIDELARFTSMLNPWKVDAEAIVHVFGRQTLSMLWDYNENNPLGTHGGTWVKRTDEIIDVVKNICGLSTLPAVATQASATQLAYPDAYFDAILTDPPYYDNVPYSYLSDFFYVWLKRTIGHLYPDLFSTPLTPKANEIVAYSNREGGWEAGKRFFEDNLRWAFQEIRRELLKHIGPEYDSVVAADITGEEAGAKKGDRELGPSYRGLRLGTRVATSIFLYSFSGGVERGATLGEVKRSATTISNPASVVAEAVELLKGHHLFYVQQQSGKYFFTNEPNLNLILLTRMENIDPKELAAEEETLLKQRVGGKRLKVFIWPDSDADIPNTPDLKLILLQERDDALMQTILKQKGATPRVHCNVLFFLVALEGERPALETLMRKRLAYQMVEDDKTLKLNPEQRKEVKDGLKKTQGDLAEAVRRTYRQLFIPARDRLKELDLGIPTYGEDRPLDEEVYEKLRLDGEVLERIVPLVIKERYLREQEYVLTEQLAQAGLRTPGETRVVSREAWEQGIAEGVRQGLFGLGALEDDRPVCHYFKERPLVGLSGSEVIIQAEVCQAQREAEEVPTTYHPPEAPVEVPVKEKIGEERPAEPLTTGQGWEQLRLRFTVPKGKVSGLMGVLNLLQHKFNRLEVVLAADEGAISAQEYEDKIREAFRQMGIEVQEE